MKAPAILPACAPRILRPALIAGALTLAFLAGTFIGSSSPPPPPPLLCRSAAGAGSAAVGAPRVSASAAAPPLPPPSAEQLLPLLLKAYAPWNDTYVTLEQLDLILRDARRELAGAADDGNGAGGTAPAPAPLRPTCGAGCALDADGGVPASRLAVVVMASGGAEGRRRARAIRDTWWRWVPRGAGHLCADVEDEELGLRTLPSLAGRPSYADAQRRQPECLKWLYARDYGAPQQEEGAGAAGGEDEEEGQVRFAVAEAAGAGAARRDGDGRRQRVPLAAAEGEGGDTATAEEQGEGGAATATARPAWYVMADDDTWVNVPLLRHLTARYDPDLPLLIGHVYDWPQQQQQQQQEGSAAAAAASGVLAQGARPKKRITLGGGAGMLLSRGAFLRMVPRMAADDDGAGAGGKGPCAAAGFNDVTLPNCAAATGVVRAHSEAFDGHDRGRDAPNPSAGHAAVHRVSERAQALRASCDSARRYGWGLWEEECAGAGA